MHSQWEEQQKNRQAESAAVRKKAWGVGSGEIMASDDEMRQTILGDVTHPTPVVIAPQQQTNTLQTAVLAAALTAAAGMGGYMLAGKGETKPTPSTEQQSVSFDDSSVIIGLGKIEDYLQRGSDK
jgi:2-methylcitrate dehydratase PrpD